jgi:hypothetical protein
MLQIAQFETIKRMLAEAQFQIINITLPLGRKKEWLLRHNSKMITTTLCLRGS